MKIGCSMQNLTRHVCKMKPSMEENVKSDVFWPFFEGSKIENLVFSIYNVFTNSLNTPYAKIYPEAPRPSFHPTNFCYQFLVL